MEKRAQVTSIHPMLVSAYYTAEFWNLFPSKTNVLNFTFGRASPRRGTNRDIKGRHWKTLLSLASPTCFLLVRKLRLRNEVNVKLSWFRPLIFWQDSMTKPPRPGMILWNVFKYWFNFIHKYRTIQIFPFLLVFLLLFNFSLNLPVSPKCRNYWNKTVCDIIFKILVDSLVIYFFHSW